MILISGSFALGIFIGAGMGLFTPLLTINNEGMPESRDGTFKYMRESREAKVAQGHLASKALKPFSMFMNALIEGHELKLVRSSL